MCKKVNRIFNLNIVLTKDLSELLFLFCVSALVSENFINSIFPISLFFYYNNSVCI